MSQTPPKPEGADQERVDQGPGRESPEAAKARSRRNIAIALSLVVFVLLVFIVTVTRMGGSVANRPL